jgi:hypothetical protein
MNDFPGLISLPQGQETAVDFAQTGSFAYRYAYTRSADSRKGDENGQDYLLFGATPSRFVFALCDGVSQSFYGDLAARLLGNRLANLFLQLDVLADEVQIHASLLEHLNTLTDEASLQVRDYPVPENVSPMLAGVLEKKRQMGSESTFVAGVIDLEKSMACFAWMGDSRLRLWSATAEITRELGNTFHTHERWSTKKGPVGELHIKQVPLSALSRVSAYSDGFSYLDQAFSQAGFSRPFGHCAINAFMADASRQPSSDDISFLEIWIGGVPQFPSEKEGFPAPFVNPDDLVVDGDFCSMKWSPVSGATGYQVEIASREGSILSDRIAGTDWQTAKLDPQAHTISVRVWHDWTPGEWSMPVSFPARPGHQTDAPTPPGLAPFPSSHEEPLPPPETTVTPHAISPPSHAPQFSAPPPPSMPPPAQVSLPRENIQSVLPAGKPPQRKSNLRGILLTGLSIFVFSCLLIIGTLTFLTGQIGSRLNLFPIPAAAETRVWPTATSYQPESTANAESAGADNDTTQADSPPIIEPTIESEYEGIPSYVIKSTRLKVAPYSREETSDEISAGTQVFVLDQDECRYRYYEGKLECRWYYVETHDGQKGWIRASEIKFDHRNSVSPTPESLLTPTPENDTSD